MPNHPLTSQSKRGVDSEFLALLVEGALKQEPHPSNESGGGGGGGSAAAIVGDDLAGRPLCKQVSELLGRVVSASATRGDPRLWEVYARFNQGAGR